MAQGHNLMLPSWAVSLSDAIARPIGSHVNVVGLVTEVFVPKITRTNGMAACNYVEAVC